MTDGANAVHLVRISASSGRVRVVAERRDVVEVVGDAAVRTDEECVTVEAGSGRIEVRVPERVELVVGATSGRVDVEGLLGSVAVVCESGRVSIDTAASLDVRTTSGRVSVKEVSGRSRVKTDSGAITVDATGEADATTDSGRINLKGVSGRTRAHCVSGRITIDLMDAVDVEAETVSGRIAITVPRGTNAHRVDGSLDLDPTPGANECTIATRSVSGRIAVKSR